LKCVITVNPGVTKSIEDSENADEQKLMKEDKENMAKVGEEK